MPTLVGLKGLLDQTIEQLVEMPKVAVEIDRGKAKYRAPDEFVLRVRAVPNHTKRMRVLLQKLEGNGT